MTYKRNLFIILASVFILLQPLKTIQATESLAPIYKRLLPLEGSNNFRDIGGYKTRDGKTVKWGLVFRSDSLDELTDSDLEALTAKNLKTVIDFRSDKERAKKPDQIPETVSKTLHLQVGATSVDPDEFKRNLLSGKLAGEDFRKMLIDGNQQMIQQGEKPYGSFLKALTNPNNIPLVFHCAGGKDRTGVGTALLLSVLGVPRETIIHDYLLTNFYRQKHDAKKLEKMKKALPDLASEISEARKARRAYIMAALTEIDTQYGGIDNYVRDVLKLDNSEIEKLKEIYLE